jgi:hypothetical protein
MNTVLMLLAVIALIINNRILISFFKFCCRETDVEEKPHFIPLKKKRKKTGEAAWRETWETEEK